MGSGALQRKRGAETAPSGLDTKTLWSASAAFYDAMIAAAFKRLCRELQLILPLPLPLFFLLFSLCIYPCAQAHDADASTAVLFDRLCCGGGACNARLQALDMRLKKEGRGGRIEFLLASLGVLPSAAAADKNACASISQGVPAGSRTQLCSWVRPSSQPFLSSSRQLTVYLLKPFISLSPSLSTSLPPASAHPLFPTQALRCSHSHSPVNTLRPTSQSTGRCSPWPVEPVPLLQHFIAHASAAATRPQTRQLRCGRRRGRR